MDQYEEGVFYNYQEEKGSNLIGVDGLTNWVRDFLMNTMDPNIYEHYYWFFFSDEELYGGLRENIKALIMQSDTTQNGKVTASEMLTAIGCKTKDALLEKYGKPYMWWRDPAFIKDAVMGTLDYNSDGSISDEELDKLLSDLQLTIDKDSIIQAYATGNHAEELRTVTGLTADELENFLSDWLVDNLLPPVWPPYWRHESDEFLYGGMNFYIGEWVKSFDTVGAGYTSLHMMMKHLGWSNTKIWNTF